MILQCVKKIKGAAAKTVCVNVAQVAAAETQNLAILKLKFKRVEEWIPDPVLFKATSDETYIRQVSVKWERPSEKHYKLRLRKNII